MPSSHPKTDQKTKTEQLNLMPYRLFAVIPCIVFFVIGFSAQEVGFLLLGLVFLPVALVTIGLDVYFWFLRQKKQ
ncbi:MAG: hypothetical protein WBP26_03705 [Candidatus Saccharimonadales bacterium]